MEDLVEWNDSICLHIDEIDNQHRVLIDIINELARALKNELIVSQISDIMKKLMKYTDTHFLFEETFFEEIAFAFKTEHLAEHKYFITRIAKFHSQIKNQPSKEISINLLDFLKKWLVTHIKNTDRKYAAEYLEYKRRKGR